MEFDWQSTDELHQWIAVFHRDVMTDCPCQGKQNAGFTRHLNSRGAIDDLIDLRKILIDLTEANELTSHAFRQRASQHGQQLRRTDLSHLQYPVSELPGTRTGIGMIGVIWAEGVDAPWLEVYVAGDAMIQLLTCSPISPFLHINHQLQMEQTRLQSSAHRLHDGVVCLQVASTHHSDVLVQVIAAYHAIQNELVGCSLYSHGGTVHLIEKEQPAVIAIRDGITFQWEGTLGADGGSFASAAAAMAEMTLAELVIYIIVNIAIMALTMTLVKLFVKAVGLEASLIIAVLMAAYGLYDAYEFGSIQGAPWAQDLLSTASNLIKEVGSSLSEAMQGLQEEAKLYGLEMENKYKLLEEAKDLLESSTLLSPWLVFGEAPQDYYSRTVHSGNIGVLAIDAISNYVDISLMLPKINQTLSFNQQPFA